MSTERRTSVLLRSEESGGQVAVVASTARAGFAGPPLHRHGFDEGFCVLEGELTFQLRGEVFMAGAGELVFAPRGVAHTYANPGERDARFLLVCTPAGFERYLGRMVAEREGREPPEWALRPIPPVETIGPRIGELEGAS
jgi:quercetin dioxygenase-like cupin family protein